MPNLIYVRVSTDDQVEYSPEAQRNRCLQLAESNGLGAVGFLRDEDWSGKNLNRLAMTELLKLVETGKVANNVVWRLDRLSRDTSDMSQLMATFEENCVSLWSVNEGQIDSPTPSTSTPSISRSFSMVSHPSRSCPKK